MEKFLCFINYNMANKPYLTSAVTYDRAFSNFRVRIGGRKMTTKEFLKRYNPLVISEWEYNNYKEFMGK